MTGHFYPANTSQASKIFPGCPLKITVAVLTGQFLSGKLVFAEQKKGFISALSRTYPVNLCTWPTKMGRISSIGREPAIEL